MPARKQRPACPVKDRRVVVAAATVPGRHRDSDLRSAAKAAKHPDKPAGAHRARCRRCATEGMGMRLRHHCITGVALAEVGFALTGPELAQTGGGLLKRATRDHPPENAQEK